jgi:hypothetical protein
MIRPILLSLALALPLGYSATTPAEAPREKGPARQEETLTAEGAKAAIVRMVRDGKAPFGDPADAVAIEKIPLEKADGGRYRLGAFTLDPARKAFSLAIIPRGPGKACAFFYEGRFLWRDGAWRAEAALKASALGEWGGNE